MKAPISIKWDLLVVRQIAVHVIAYARVAESAALATIDQIDRLLEGDDPIVSFAASVKSPVTSTNEQEGLS